MASGGSEDTPAAERRRHSGAIRVKRHPRASPRAGALLTGRSARPGEAPDASGVEHRRATWRGPSRLRRRAPARDLERPEALQASSTSPQSEHAPPTSGAAVPHAGQGSSSSSPTESAPTDTGGGGSPPVSRATIRCHSDCISAAIFAKSVSWTRRTSLVPQPLPAAGGRSIVAGMSAARHRDNSSLMSFIEPCTASTTSQSARARRASLSVIGSV